MIPMQTPVQQQPAWAAAAARRASFGTVVGVELRKMSATVADKILLIAAPIGVVVLSIMFMVDSSHPYTLEKQMGSVFLTVRLAAVLVDLTVVKLIAAEWHYRSSQPTLLAQPSRMRYVFAQATIAIGAWLLVSGVHILMTFTYLSGRLDLRDVQNLLTVRPGMVVAACLIGAFCMTLLAVTIGWLIPNTAGAITTYVLVSLLFTILQGGTDVAGWVDPIEPAQQISGVAEHGVIALVTSLVLWLGLAAVAIVRAGRREAA